MRRQRRFLGLGCLTACVLSVWAVGGVRGAEAGAPGPIKDGIRNDRPSFYVRAEVDRPNRVYQEGDTLSARVLTGEDAFIYVLYQQADGKVFQIFPNSAQPNNRVASGQAVEIPGKGDRFRWRVAPPFGKEVLLIVAAREPLKIMADAALTKEMFNPVNDKTLKGIRLELDKVETKTWTEAAVEIQTTPRGQAAAPPALPAVPAPPAPPAPSTTPASPAPPVPPAPKNRRLGVFFGVSKYQYDEQARAVSEDKRGLNLRGCRNDANLLAKAFKEAGRLDEVRVYTDEQATRRQMEETITGWLARGSAPGDTVVIFFSGHGGQIADDNGDELTDGLDEYLLPHDFIDFLIWNQLVKGKKPEEADPRLIELAKVALTAAGPEPDRKDKEAWLKWAMKVNDSMCRDTGITDDLFGHWVQKLDGRQVVVILDACHSGGFANQEKGRGNSNDDGSFDFLDRELARLKDIGQRETAVLTACATKEIALTRGDVELGILSSFLLDVLRGSSGPVDVDRAFAFCSSGMKEYFESDAFRQLSDKIARQNGEPPKPFRPVLYQDLSRPAYLKP